MATLLALKRRIKAAQNVSKTTRAMQMIAASKLRKAQEATLTARPYIEKLTELSKAVGSGAREDFSHPYLTTHTNTGKKLLIVISPDKGLCGGLVTNLTREIMKLDQKQYIFVVVGKKVEHYVIMCGSEIIATFPFGTTLPSFEIVFPIVGIVEEHFGQKVDSIEILSTKFVNIFSQKPVTTKILPIEMSAESLDNKTSARHELFEPNAESILPSLLTKYLEMTVYQQVLESYLSEQAARMLSMQNATNNAKDIIQDLRLEYNKNRQAKITSEILDIAGGRIHANTN